MCEDAVELVYLVCLVHLVDFVCLISFVQLKNQTHKTNQMNQTNQIDQMNQATVCQTINRHPTTLHNQRPLVRLTNRGVSR